MSEPGAGSGGVSALSGAVGGGGMPARREYAADPAGGAAIVIGRLWHADRTTAVAGSELSTVDAHRALAEAFESVPADLDRLAQRLAGMGQTEPAHIAAATADIARDPELRTLAEQRLAAGATPVAAISAAIEHFARLLAELPDPLIAARAADVRAVGRRLVAALVHPTDDAVDADAMPAAPEHAEGERILIGWEVTADDLLTGSGATSGAVSVVGGATAHVGIVARSLGLPVLFGIDPTLLDLPDGTEVLLDARLGRIVVAPGPADRELAQADAAVRRQRRASLAASRTSDLSTRDGERVSVLANVASAVESELAVRYGALGVGLLRTEMPFLGATAWPTFEEHLAALNSVLRPLRGLPVTVRTLDFADDKLPPFLRPVSSAGPGNAVAGQGLTLLLDRPEAFADQLRAILRAAVECGVAVSIMFPMVDSAVTMEQCRSLVAIAAEALDMPMPSVGTMVERQEAIEAIDELAAVADFLSIGTNDLSASLLGLGRRDPALTPDRIREPVVRDAIASTVEAGRTHGRSVSVCGDAASDPDLVPFLLGLGVRALSVAPAMIDEVRAAVRGARF